MKLYRLCFTPSGYYTVSNYRVIESLLEISIWNPRNVKNSGIWEKLSSLLFWNLVSLSLQGISSILAG